LEQRGLMRFSGEQVRLTDPGRDRALHLVRAHRLWERFLADRTGFDEREWHERAERREHQLSREQAERLSASLGHPAFDPHGDPIPSADGEWTLQPGMPLSAAREGQRLQVTHIEDEPQALYVELLPLGLNPGTELQVERAAPEGLQLEVAGEPRRLSILAAGNVTVRVLPPAERPAAVRLSALPVGQSARVIGLLPACRGAERRRLQDLGVLPGTQVRAELASPAGDPVAYRIRGALIALRREQAEHIQVERDSA
jgi:DtxR family Mn-dependent transcriptional regulator